jgi:heterodisulfide reductase subunit B
MHMDMQPNVLMRAIQLGREEQVLSATTTWLCAHCETCGSRCPQGIDIPLLMTTVRQVAKERGLKPVIPDVATFYDLSNAWISRTGRIFELGLMGEMNLRTLQPMRNAGLGIRMLKAGKLKFFPSVSRRRGKSPKPAATRQQNPKRVAYYPGCSLHSSASEYDFSTRVVAGKLGLQLVEPEGWVCCGTGAAFVKSRELGTVLPMKNLALIDAAGDHSVALPCAECYSRFRTAAHDVQTEPKLRQAVIDQLGYEYNGDIKIRNMIDTFTEVVGLDEIEKRVVKPLEGLKVVCYYGCLLSRPPAVPREERFEYPMSMDRIVKRLGAEVLDWQYKTDCCGASLMLTQPEIALSMTEKILRGAMEIGAEAVAVACPICHANLDNRQYQIAAQAGRKIDLPIFYFTQLMGLALGAHPKELELQKHFVSPRLLLQRKDLLKKPVIGSA